jgi:DUF438 domain-containing protein
MAQQNELFELLKSGGKIVSSASCTVLEIAEAMSCNRMYVDKDGFGFVYFPSKVKPSTETIHRRTTKEQTKKLQEGLQLYAKNNPTALVATMAQQTFTRQEVINVLNVIMKHRELTIIGNASYSVLNGEELLILAEQNHNQ